MVSPSAAAPSSAALGIGARWVAHWVRKFIQVSKAAEGFGFEVHANAGSHTQHRSRRARAGSVGGGLGCSVWSGRCGLRQGPKKQEN